MRFVNAEKNIFVKFAKQLFLIIFPPNEDKSSAGIEKHPLILSHDGISQSFPGVELTTSGSAGMIIILINYVNEFICLAPYTC